MSEASEKPFDARRELVKAGIKLGTENAELKARIRALEEDRDAVLEKAVRLVERIPVESYHCSEAIVLRALATAIRALKTDG